MDEKPSTLLSEAYMDIVEGRVKPVPSPLGRFNTSIGGGFREGQVTVVAGTAGSGKSYFLVQHMLDWTKADIPWKYKPLEDSKIDVLQRMLAINTHSWDPVTQTEEAALNATELSLDPNNITVMKRAGRCIEENTMVEGVDVNNWGMVESWMRQQADAGQRVIVVDPVSQINFVQEFKRSFDLENKFMQNITGWVKNYPCHIILVCHMTKGDGGNGSIRGSAAFTNLAHNDIRIMGHEQRESPIFIPEGGRDSVTHNKTIYISKARNGHTGKSIACRVGNNGPEFMELGYIAPEEKKGKYGRN